MKKSGLKWCVEEEIKTLAPPITAFFISLFLTCFSSQLFLYQGCRGDWIYWARSRTLHLTGCLKTRTCLTFSSLVYSALDCDKKKYWKKQTNKQKKKSSHLTTQQILHNNKSSSAIFLKHLTTKKLTKWKTDYLLLIYIFLFQRNEPLGEVLLRSHKCHPQIQSVFSLSAEMKIWQKDKTLLHVSKEVTWLHVSLCRHRENSKY